MTLIKESYSDFVDLCRSHKVDKIYAFGSSITDHFDPKTSDIDVVVKIDIDDPVDRGEALLSLWDNLEILFNRKVDLLTEDSIRNPYLKSNINRTKKLIYSDISSSIELIENFTQDLKSFTEYQNDLKTKGAVERHLAIIGEAVNKFLKESDANDLKNATQIISLRNRLIHSYDNVDDSIIWSIITRHLRPLKDEVNKKLE